MLLNFGISCPCQLEGGQLEWILEFRTLNNEDLTFKTQENENSKWQVEFRNNQKLKLDYHVITRLTIEWKRNLDFRLQTLKFE